MPIKGIFFSLMSKIIHLRYCAFYSYLKFIGLEQSPLFTYFSSDVVLDDASRAAHVNKPLQYGCSVHHDIDHDVVPK